MRIIYTFLTLCIVCGNAQNLHAQWTSDPANPQVISDYSGKQWDMRAFADGAGGVYAFWLDNRNGNYDVYGQHFDQDGFILWEEDGREILNYNGAINSYSITYDAAGNMLAGAIVNTQGQPDSLLFQSIDNNGATLWSQPLHAASSDGCSGFYILYLTNFNVVHDASGYVVRLMVAYCGGSNGNRIIHITDDGNLTGNLNGNAEGNQNYVGYSSLDLTYDNSGDIYLFHTNGNGAGAHATAYRISSDGDTLWGPVDVLAGTNGLNYQFSGISDDNGITFVWEESSGGSNNLYARRLNTSGEDAWSPAIRTIVDADGAQGTFDWRRKGNYYYIAWSDGRPGVVGNAAIYGQKFDTDGTMHWTEDGVEIADLNTYIPYPHIAVTEADEMLVVHQSTVAGYVAQLVSTDGIVLWDADGYQLATTSYNADYTSHIPVVTGSNKIVAWTKSGDGGGDNNYIHRITQTVAITEDVNSCNNYTFNGETYTESGVYEQQTGDTLLTINLTITTIENEVTSNGETITSTNTEGEYLWIDCESGIAIAYGSNTYTPSETGSYALVVTQGNCSDTSDCVLVEVIGVEEYRHRMVVSLYPDPAHNQLNIALSKDAEDILLQLIDISGRIVAEQRNISGRQWSVDVSSLASGSYFIRLVTEKIQYTGHWQKL